MLVSIVIDNPSIFLLVRAKVISAPLSTNKGKTTMEKNDEFKKTTTECTDYTEVLVVTTFLKIIRKSNIKSHQAA